MNHNANLVKHFSKLSPREEYIYCWEEDNGMKVMMNIGILINDLNIVEFIKRTKSIKGLLWIRNI